MNKKVSTQNQFPEGWDEARVHRLIAHYENQSEGEAVAEHEAVLFEASLVPKQKVNTVWAVVQNGRIVLLDQIQLVEGSKLLVTLLPEAIPAIYTTNGHKLSFF